MKLQPNVSYDFGIWLMWTLDQLLSRLEQLGASRFLAKRLSPNDNSKNQFYVGGSSEVFAVLPPIEIIPDQNQAGKPSFKAPLNLSWIDEAGGVEQAPDARLIYYPQYPEVRMSSLITGCPNAPSALLASRNEGRVLVLGVANDRRIFAFICEPPHPVAQHILALDRHSDEGVFHTLTLKVAALSPEQRLLSELCRISRNGWMVGKRLLSSGSIVACKAPNCAGYTLEAELGISANGYSEPDYLGWEVKTFTVPTLESARNVVITLMTPEPTGGVYVERGVDEFVRCYGYPDRKGRSDRLNFGGIFRSGVRHELTGMTISLDGVDDQGVLQRADGQLMLVDAAGHMAASWSFKSLLEHWNRKHSKTAFVPNTMRKTDDLREYAFGRMVRLGIGTEFSLFLRSLASGKAYYDPAIKIEGASLSRPRVKRRSQFRTNSHGLQELYHSWKVVDACADGRADN